MNADDIPFLNPQRKAQMERLRAFAAGNALPVPVVSEITVREAALEGMDWTHLPITLEGVTRHYRVINAVWHEWNGIGPVVTLGLYLKNPEVYAWSNDAG